MPDFSTRSNEPEIMDDFEIADNGLIQTLHEIETINQLLGGNHVTLQGIGELLKKHPKEQPIRIADLGCGGGEMLRLIWDRFSEEYPNLQLIGYDANPTIIAHAQKKAISYSAIQFVCEDILSDKFQASSFDIIICTLFTHHFDNQQLLEMLNGWYKQVGTGVVINDIHRHWFAFYSIKMLVGLLSKSYMTRYDAKLSVLRSFKKSEIIELLAQSNWTNNSIKWKWAFRWQILLKK